MELSNTCTIQASAAATRQALDDRALVKLAGMLAQVGSRLVGYAVSKLAGDFSAAVSAKRAASQAPALPVSTLVTGTHQLWLLKGGR